MKMTFRWYGSQMDPIPLRYIKQIPNMSGVVSSLMDMPAGALWPTERIQALKQEVNDAGLELEVMARFPAAAAPRTILTAASSLSACRNTPPIFGIRFAI